MIIGERVRLRAPERGDIDRWLVWFNDPEVIETLSVHLPLSRDQEERFFQAQLDNSNDVLLVEGLDAIDGTLVLDVKPYYPPYDEPRGEARVPDYLWRLAS